MVTMNVQGLSPGVCVYATAIDAQGHTLTDLWVHARQDGYVLETDPGLEEKLRASLDRYLIADDVEMKGVTEGWTLLGLRGPRASSVLDEAVGGLPSDLPANHSHTVLVGGTEIAIVARPNAPAPGYDLWLAPGRTRALWHGLVEAGARPVGSAALEIVRVEAGIPRYGAEITEQVTPLEAGLIGAVDFAKGCYIGQEVIAKMHHRGKPRRVLVGLRIEADAPPDPGTPVTAEGKSIGQVTSSVRSPGLSQTIGLSLIRRGFEDEGRLVSIGPDTQAEILPLPFLHPPTDKAQPPMGTDRH
jgi:aminomethyltransferase